MIRLVEILAAGVTNDSGAVLANGKVTSYDAGTTTLTTLFQDFELETPHPNPLTLDVAGRAIAYVDGRVKLVISTSADAVVRTVDNVGTSDSDITAASNSGLAGNALVAASDGSLDVNVDGTSVSIASDALTIPSGGISTAKIADLGVTTAKIAAGAVTQAKRVALGQTISSSSGAFTTSSTSYTAITNLTAAITTTGRLVFIGLISDGSGNSSYIGTLSTVTISNPTTTIRIKRDATEVAAQNVYLLTTATTGGSRPMGLPFHLDLPAAGSYTYTVEMKTNDTGAAGVVGSCNYCKLVVFEL